MSETEKQAVLRLATEAGWVARDHGDYAEVTRRLDYIYVMFSEPDAAVAISIRYGQIAGVGSLEIVLEYLRRPKW